MNDNPTDLPEKIASPEGDDSLMTLKDIARRLSLSTREINRNKDVWTGFPAQLPLGYKTKRYSSRAFQNWLKEFIEQHTNKTTVTP